MKGCAMMQSDYTAIVLFRLLFMVALLAAPPSEFWMAVSAAMTIPDDIKVMVAPFMGAAVATAIEYLIHLRKRTLAPASPVYWPLKVFVSWIAGTYGGSGLEAVAKGDPETIAFWAGVLSYGAVALALATQNKEIRDKDKDEEETQA